MVRLVEKPLHRFVLDCSVAMSQFFQDEANGYADGVLRLAATAEIVVPTLWHLEVANTLVVGERRGRSTSGQAAEFFSFLGRLIFTTDRNTAQEAWSRTILYAREHGLSAYDAAVLELASREQLPLATTDRVLCKAANAERIPILKP